MASLEQILQRSASGHVSWLSERASRTRSAERGRGRPTRQLWSVIAPLIVHLFTSAHYCSAAASDVLHVTLIFCFLNRRWKRMILCRRSGRITLKRQCDLLVAPSVTTTFANMRCLLRHCSRAGALAASGTVLTICIHVGSCVD